MLAAELLGLLVFLVKAALVTAAVYGAGALLIWWVSRRPPKEEPLSMPKGGFFEVVPGQTRAR